MVFKRRDKPSLWTRIRELLAPKKGWRRGFRYIGRRVQRLPDTPHKIAIGVACGAFISFTPLFTLHLVVAALLAMLLRGNILASAFGTAIGNPLTFPFIAAISLKLGNLILGRASGVEGIDHLSLSYVWEHLGEFLIDIFIPYLVGGIAPGLLCAAVLYYLLRPAIGAYQKRRREKLMDRAHRKIRERAARRPPLATGADARDEMA